MRRAVMLVHRAVIGAQAGEAPELPATEEVLVNDVSGYYGGVVGSTENNPGVVAVLSDNNDETHVFGTFGPYVLIGFAPLQDAGGRQVQSFTLTCRASAEFDVSGLAVDTFDGIAPSPSQAFGALPAADGTPYEVAVGPFTGPFSAAAFDGMTCQVLLDAENATLNRISCTVTYAT
jgi:hypothetical protein